MRSLLKALVVYGILIASSDPAFALDKEKEIQACNRSSFFNNILSAITGQKSLKRSVELSHSYASKVHAIQIELPPLPEDEPKIVQVKTVETPPEVVIPKETKEVRRLRMKLEREQNLQYRELESYKKSKERCLVCLK